MQKAVVRGGVLAGSAVRTSESFHSAGFCAVCGARDKLLRCARCREAVYCGKQHQREDWARHKKRCRALTADRPVITSEGSSESEILSACAQTLSEGDGAMPEYQVQVADWRARREYPAATLPPYVHSTLGDDEEDGDDPFREICNTVVRDMNQYGLCVLDDFLGAERGSLVLREVMRMYSAGIFKDGQLVSSSAQTESKTIRGDQIAWIDGKEAQCLQIGQLIQQVDNIIMRANRMSNNGKMGDYIINGRTKAMVACYPGSGSHYVKHVDNPNKDGRCITAIYYLNRHWDVATCGGLLRIFPDGWADQVADIAPVFDRILFFWSDRRNPHEVQPAFHTRYAITLWYFDAVEREEATRRYRDNQIAAAASSSQ